MVSEPLCPPSPKLPHNGEEDYFLFFTLSAELWVWAHSDAPEGCAVFFAAACWKELDPTGAKNRGLLSLMRRHRHHLKPEQHVRLSQYLRENPAMEAVYRFKQKLCYLLLNKRLNQDKCRELAPKLLRMIALLREQPLPQMVQLGNTLHSWREEIATMWRFTRNNGITEGFHTKMEVLQRQAYGFRNFNNYRLRVKVMCS